ncbi:AAA family ATPase [Streptomyces sp. NPDC048659]|uniref:AAA family ATPase n=1 Tax=Streptomyces sp. NPDC048659 TaxID=3155489 RepID=UPI0034139CE9
MNRITGEGSVDRAPFAGRRAELARLEELLGAPGRRGSDAPRAVDLTGEPGIGKSRLLAELTARARRAGVTVLHGRAPARERPLPYEVFADAFADLAAPAEDTARVPCGAGRTPPRRGARSRPRPPWTPPDLTTAPCPERPAPAQEPGAPSAPGDRPAPGTPPGLPPAPGFYTEPGHPPSPGLPPTPGPRPESGFPPAYGLLRYAAEAGAPVAPGAWPDPVGYGWDGGTGETGAPVTPGVWPDPVGFGRDGGTGWDGASGRGGWDGATGWHPAPGYPAASMTGLPPQLRPEPYGVFRRVADALARCAQPALLLVLDDVHRADRASLDLIDHLLRHPVAAPVLLVMARRERRTPPDLAAVLARAAESGALTRIALGPLDEADCADGLAPGLPPARAAELHAASGGNPGYFLALAGGRAGGGALAALLGELAPLGPAARAVVDAVALLDEDARTDLLPAVTGASRDELVHAVRELVRLDLVRPRPDGHTLELRHPALARLVRHAMDPLRRREYHRRAAEGLAGAGAPATTRARHIERYLTRWEPGAAAALVRAAELTEATDPALAARRLAAVLDVLPDAPEHRQARVELKLRRARALGLAGRVEESRDLLHRLLALCREDAPGRRSGARCPASPGEEEPRSAAVLLCAFMERHLGRYREADALIRRELRRGAGPRPALRLRLVVEWGCRALFEARYPEVRAELAVTLAAARARGDETGTLAALTLGALGEAYEGETRTARAYAAEAAALVDAMTDGELSRSFEALVRLGWSEIFLDDPASAERHTTRGVTLARRTGRPFALSQLLLCAGYVQSLTGRVDTSLALADEALALARTLGGAEVAGFTRAIRATILLQARPLGDPEALAAAEEAAATVGAADGWWATLARGLLAHAIPLTTDPHRVRDVLVAAGGGPGLPRIQPSVRPGFLELLAAARLATGDPAGAERAARLAETEAARLDLPVQRAAALRARARLLLHAGEQAAAAALFAESADTYARTGIGLREAHTLLLGAPVARAAGDGAEAAAMWRRARGLATAGGARLLTDLADRTRTAALGPDTAGPGTTAADPGGPLAALTPREREISALVAEGLTNQAVADRLCLSPRTVESHVARVYRKTGVVTRAGLASLVARATS